MSKRRPPRWGWVLCASLGGGACGQELFVPLDERPSVEASAGAVYEGFTGMAGAVEGGDTAESLPLAEPIHTPHNGVGGEAAGGNPSIFDELATERAVGGAPAGAGPGGQRSDASLAGQGGAIPVGPAGPPELLFSEYVEGSGNFKALEIYALADSSLEGCEVQTFSNGKLERPTRLALHGVLAARETYVLCSSALAKAELAKCDRSTSLMFNGDDALALVCAASTLDVFGQIGNDPGTAWGDGLTVDHTLRRRCAVQRGQSDGEQPFEPGAQWLTFGLDTFSDLGAHSCSPE
jgi:hypothetical protein